jgi:membrane-associated protease RseP (regulator of RpoE activity)
MKAFMKIYRPINGILRPRTILIVGVLFAGLAAGSVLAQEDPFRTTTLGSGSSGGGGTSGSGGGGFGGGRTAFYPAPQPGQQQMLFRTDMSDEGPAKDLPWLGVAVSETTEPLSAQLGLKRGEGLVVNLVSSNSPAAAAGLEKNDVLVAVDGQMLVDAVQLRKLVQMHAEGDMVKLEYYRAGKKESASAKLTLTPPEEALQDMNSIPFGHYQQRLNKVLATATVADNGRINAEVQRTVAEAQRALQEALVKSETQMGSMNEKLQKLHVELGSLANGGFNLGTDTTVVVKNDTDSVRTLVRKDETGTYLIVADPAKHLTAHNPGGKLIFDGPIDTPEQQKKVPSEMWKKVEPMLSQLDQNSSSGTSVPTAPEPPTPPEPPVAPEAPQR